MAEYNAMGSCPLFNCHVAILSWTMSAPTRGRLTREGSRQFLLRVGYLTTCHSANWLLHASGLGQLVPCWYSMYKAQPISGTEASHPHHVLTSHCLRYSLLCLFDAGLPAWPFQSDREIQFLAPSTGTHVLSYCSDTYPRQPAQMFDHLSPTTGSIGYNFIKIQMSMVCLGYLHPADWKEDTSFSSALRDVRVLLVHSGLQQMHFPSSTISLWLSLLDSHLRCFILHSYDWCCYSRGMRNCFFAWNCKDCSTFLILISKKC